MNKKLYKTKYDFFYFIHFLQETPINQVNFSYYFDSGFTNNIKLLNNSKDVIVVCLEERENIYLNIGFTYIFKDICKILINGEIGWVDKEVLNAL